MTIANTILIICFTSIFWLLILLNELRVHRNYKKELETIYNMICEDYEDIVKTQKEMITELYEELEDKIIESEGK